MQQPSLASAGKPVQIDCCIQTSFVSLLDLCATTRALVKLDISRNGIGPAGAKAIAEALDGNQGLTELNLADNRLGAEGVQHFLGAIQALEGSLAKLDISSNRFGAEGAKSLASALEHNSVLKDLNVADNRMAWNARGARDMSGVIAFSNTIKTMRELVRLVIKNNCLTNREGGEGGGAAHARSSYAVQAAHEEENCF